MQPAESYALRPMAGADVAEVARIEAAVQTHPWPAAQFQASLDAGHCGLVLVENGHLVGFAVVMLAVDDAELLDIGVRGDCQGRGLGRQLLSAATSWARRSGARRLLLEVRASNVAALQLYDAAGFRVYHVRKGYYPTALGREDALLMECPL